MVLQNDYNIIAAIPCYNTEDFIGSIVSQAKKYVKKVFVVDDGSADNTAVTAEVAGALVENHKANMGYGGAIISCFKIAEAHKADALCIFDGDGQHNPGDLPAVLAPILNKEADIVIGSRLLKESGNMPTYRKVGIKIITFLCNFGHKAKISDAQSGFRAYNRNAINAIKLTDKGMGISVEIVIRARHNRLRIKEVPISCLYHSRSSNLNPIIHGLSVALTVIKYRLKYFA